MRSRAVVGGDGMKTATMVGWRFSDLSLNMHISYNIFTFIPYKILLIILFLCVSRSMMWNEEDDKKSPFLIILA